MKKMKKKVLSILLTLSVLVSLYVPKVSAATQLTTAQVEKVISWALSKQGNKSYAYLCQKFVADAYSQVAPRVSKETAKQAANAWCTHPGDKNPPRGATVYYNWYGKVDGVYANYGHVGIALGDGRVIHAYGNSGVVISNKIDFMTGYIGWGVNGGFTLPENQPDPDPIHQNSTAYVRNGFFTLKNASSGKYMNVNGGKDANSTAINMWSYDDSTDQEFNVVHQGNGKYRLYAYCSSAGTNRVVDIYRNGAAPAAGQLVDLWTPNDDVAQLFYIVPISGDSYVLELSSKSGYVIAPTSASAANTNSSQLTLQRYTGAAYQQWKLCNCNGKETYAMGSYTTGSYSVDTNGTNLIMRSGAGTNYNIVTRIPDKTVLNVTSINSNWGYTSYNGSSGWVCLDFAAVYTPTITSISIKTEPFNTNYYVDETLDPVGLEITATYSNGSTQNIDSGFTTSYDFSSAGQKTVTVTYSGKTTSFTVDVLDVAISDLEISVPATKTNYKIGDTLDTTDLALLATYNNGSTTTVTSGYSTNYDFSSPGTKTVTITYEGLTATYDVTVESASTATLTVNTQESTHYGEELTVAIDLSGSQNIYDGNFNIAYDNNVLELMSSTLGNSLNGHNPIINENYASNRARVTFAGTSALFDGNLLTLKFKVISDSVGFTSISIEDVNMYNISGNIATTTCVNADTSILRYDYTITDYYLLDSSDNYITDIPTNGDFYIGITFNKNSEGTSRPCIIYAVYDDSNKLIAFSYEQNRYSQNNNQTCETLISLPQNCRKPQYIKSFIWDSMPSMRPISNSFSTK